MKPTPGNLGIIGNMLVAKPIKRFLLHILVNLTNFVNKPIFREMEARKNNGSIQLRNHVGLIHNLYHSVWNDTGRSRLSLGVKFKMKGGENMRAYAVIKEDGKIKFSAGGGSRLLIYAEKDDAKGASYSDKGEKVGKVNVIIKKL
jgi:hypothetical protein